MWSERNQYTEHLGLSLPQDNRLSWNPWSTVTFQMAGSDENQHIWNPWTSSVFLDSRSNENRQLWNPWLDVSHQETKNNVNQERYQLFNESKNFSGVVGSNLNRMQSKPGSFVPDEAVIFQNISNENRLKYYQNSGPTHTNFFPRRKNRKNRRLNRTLKTVVNNVNSSHNLQEHERWNHQPVMNWSQTNLPPRPFEANLHNPFRSTSFRKRGVKARRFQNSTHGKSANDSSNFSCSKITKRAEAPRDNFKSCNLSNHSKNNMSNTVSLNSSNVKNKNGLTVIGSKMYPITASANSENITDVHESSNEDITYLFTVDCSSEAKMVLEVDLRSNEINLVSNKNSKADNAIKKKDASEDQSNAIPVKPELTEPRTSRKRKLSNTNDKNKKRPSYQPECMTCNMRYDDVINKCESMYISSNCSHIFCHPCISKDENAKVCPVCGVKFILLRRLYL